MGGWLCPSCPHQELLLRREPREVCAQGWQFLGPVASKDSSPASIFPNLSASSQVMLLRSPSIPFCSPCLQGASPGQAHGARVPTLRRAEDPPGAGVGAWRARGLGQGSLQQSGGNQTPSDSG